MVYFTENLTKKWYPWLWKPPLGLMETTRNNKKPVTAVCQQPLKNGGVFEVYHQSRWFMFRKLRVLMVLIYIYIYVFFMVFRLLSNKTRYVFFIYGLSVDDVSWFTFSNMVVFHGYHPLVIERGSGKFMIFLVVEPPSWKIMEFFSWDDDIPNWMESHKIHVPNHRPVCGYFPLPSLITGGLFAERINHHPKRWDPRHSTPASAEPAIPVSTTRK